jgi:tRNA (guanine-N7-)-methyltransferase
MKRSIIEYDAVVLRPDDLDGQLDFARIFGRQNPVHLEIGSGKGTFLVHQAKAEPEIDFLGIEWARKYYRYAADRLGRWGLRNVRITRADAVTFLNDHVPPRSIDCLHIYFPDPWPKKRHHKRRLLQRANMDLLIGRLRVGGGMRIATDHAGYFAQIEEVAASCRDQLEPIAFTRPAGAEEGELTGTNFERKYIRDQRTINTLALRRKDA